MGKDRAGQAHCRARLEVTLPFAGGGACETWRITYNGSDRIVRAGYPICLNALGVTENTILLFQVPDSVTSVDSLDLFVNISGTNYQITL